MSDILIETIGLKKYFKTGSGMLHAVDDVNIKIAKGETLGVVGESGCGKTTLGRTVLRLNEATDGKVLFEGKDILQFMNKEMKKIRRDMQIIFQDPYSSLNPRMTVRDLIAEPIIVNKICSNKSEIEDKVFDIMKTVGLSYRTVNMYPHEMDGGRRQRIGIGRALALNPKFIVCDEPVSALDVSIQAQILNLLMDLSDEHGYSYMFITHNLSVAKHISDQILVMYMGNCVELASSDELFEEQYHPYTKALLNSIPKPTLESRKTPLHILRGEVSSPIDPKPGCRFALRCPYVRTDCMGEDIPFIEVKPKHFVACRLAEEGKSLS
ncbi:ABC transporter ATP-binding protein [Paratissierella segnis]|jgi:peptide/nickel transport system ATP-binding protein|uniref:ATP-binding cassette domain-containing protein n=1 Tax=Paratissierella segnis TaxID=2763679 RepID=A0A926EZT7_9FIRM|nr:oligopeptide/dipeptide ABC transporter ATP-binding protein [Paratissierella segnis]MBC8589285.1 ATP-binding cassette domain-containing protein [Paratissierella segnis]